MLNGNFVFPQLNPNQFEEIPQRGMLILILLREICSSSEALRM